MPIRTALRRYGLLVLSTVCFSTVVFAVDTKVWDQSDESDFSHGTAKQLAIRSDGRLSLSPEFKELDSTTIPYLWTVVQDSKGTLYYSGGAPTGATARIIAMRPGEKSKVYSEIAGLEIHALALDAKDQLYAAVQPDAKIYRIGADGKPVVFFDPKQKYVWALAFDKAGNLYAATGDNGLIYKITPDGKGSEFANTFETHARSMIVDGAGNLIVGTEPGGLVMRIKPDGERFVLYQTGKREITALAERQDVIYAAAVGTRSTVTGAVPVLPVAQPAVNGAGQTKPPAAPTPSAPPLVAMNVSITGGSDLFRIERDGYTERIWDSSSDLIYGLAFDGRGRPLIGTGNKGVIYRIESDQLSTRLLNAPATQVTTLLNGKNGEVYAATGNVGNLYQIGPSTASSGTLESDVLDAGFFSYWGKAHVTDELNGGHIALRTRSGNLSDAQHDWSPWSDVEVIKTGGDVHAPPARFLQYELTLKRAPNGDSPVVTSVDIPFLAKNATPRIARIEVEPINYRESPSGAGLERNTQPSGSPITMSVPAVGQKRSASENESGAGAAPAATLQYAKGFETVRWSASDPNGDPLKFKVEVRPRAAQTWMVLKDNLVDRWYAIDTTALPDGEYVARITATDAPGNVPGSELTATLESDPFTVDNTPPQINDVRRTSAGIEFTAKDDLNWIAKTQYSSDGGAWADLQPVHKVNDSQVLHFEVPAKPGQRVTVRVFDDADNVAVKQLGAE